MILPRLHRQQHQKPLFILDSSDDGAPIYKFQAALNHTTFSLHNNFLITAVGLDAAFPIVNHHQINHAYHRLDKYESISPQNGEREILSHPPGSLVIADGRLFVGQVFSDFVLVIDLATHAIVKRIVLPGGGNGQLAVSQNEKEIYFATIESTSSTSLTVPHTL